MRDIKFRGKRNYEWIYGGSLSQGSKHWIIRKIDEAFSADLVDPKTLGQYAGFKDDSDDPVEVFENDIVQLHYLGEGHTCEVVYAGSGFMFVADSLPDGYIWAHEFAEYDGEYGWADGVMVVGNKHDNELAPKEGADKHETD